MFIESPFGIEMYFWGIIAYRLYFGKDCATIEPKNTLIFGGEMISWTQSDFFVVSFVKQEKEARQPWKVELLFGNLGIEPNYFVQCLEKVFLNDRGVVTVSGNKVVFEREDKIRDEGKFCKAKAGELLDLLRRHPLWGKPGGPDQSAIYNRLD